MMYVSPLIVDTPAMPFQSGPAATATKRAPARERMPPKEATETPGETREPPPVAPVRARLPSELNGTYTGLWQITVYAASGAAVMTVSTEGNTVHAEIALTGGNVTRDALTGEASEVGGGWSIKLRNANGDLYATGIFKNGAFEGDYDFVPASDHGRWGLKKD